MQNIPCNLGGYTLMVVEPPELKMRETEDGKSEVVVDQQSNAQMFVVSLFAKLREAPEGRRRPKGEEIKVTLETDPGDGFTDGDYVELINPRVSPYSIQSKTGTIAGISFKAGGLTPRS